MNDELYIDEVELIIDLLKSNLKLLPNGESHTILDGLIRKLERIVDSEGTREIKKGD